METALAISNAFKMADKMRMTDVSKIADGLN
jgi:hypothetical protein